jgi:hypothetical protein
MQIAEAYCENGPLHGRTVVVKELLQMQLNGGFYMRNEFQATKTTGQQMPLYLWLGAEDWNVTVTIGESSKAVTIDSARIDRNGVTWMRLRNVGIDPELYAIWKRTADRQTDMSVVFQGRTYQGRTDVVGKNDVDGYMFLQFQGRSAT